MATPQFIRHHKVSKDDAVRLSDFMSNPNKAKVWIAEVRGEINCTRRYNLLGQALNYELMNRQRRSVITQLRGAYNRARGHVERDILEEYLETCT